MTNRPGATPIKWIVRDPEGYYDSIQATGTTVAPILAGFAFAILAIVLVPPGKGTADPMRWRDAALALLVFSALLLIISTQAAILARQTAVKPDELRMWHPASFDAAGRPNRWLLARQQMLDAQTLRASAACRHAYNAGTLLLFTAIAVLLVPAGPVDNARRIVLGAATIGVAFEAAWLSLASIRHPKLAERLPAVLTPAGYAATAVIITLTTQSSAATRTASAAAIAIASAAAAAPAIRLVLGKYGFWIGVLGLVLLQGSAAAAVAAWLLLGTWAHRILFTEIVAAALAFLLLVAVICVRPGARSG